MSGPQAFRHKDLLHFIRAEMETKGIAPSFDEMLVFTGTSSKSGMERIMRDLEGRGFIRRMPRRARAIELLQTKDYDRPDCDCESCAIVRHFEMLKLVKALQVFPPDTLVPKLCGLRSPGHLERLYWLKGLPRKLASALKRAGAGP